MSSNSDPHFGNCVQAEHSKGLEDGCHISLSAKGDKALSVEQYDSSCSGGQQPEPKKRDHELDDMITHEPRVFLEHAPNTVPNLRTCSRQPSCQEVEGHHNRNRHHRVAGMFHPLGTNRATACIGPWVLGRIIGEGTSGCVYKACHRQTAELVAIKVIGRATATSTDLGSMAQMAHLDTIVTEGNPVLPILIEREVAILKLLDHPNIVKLHDIWENSARVYLVLEHAELGNLRTFSDTWGPFSEREAMFIFRQIMSAVDYLHQLNICHRDLKCENILVADGGIIKLADFGFAALKQGPDDLLSTCCGSPHYAAPELIQTQNAQYDGIKSDMWSLGVILYAILTNKLPFYDPSPNVIHTLRLISIGKYHMPSHIDIQCQRLLTRLLERDPDKRMTMEKLWDYPTVRRYKDEDIVPQPGPDPRRYGHDEPVAMHEQDPDILRQLRVLWHRLSESSLRAMLSSSEKNDVKFFYWMIYDYREQKLAEYGSQVPASSADYHHIRPGVKARRVQRVCDFTEVDGSTYRLTVVTNETCEGQNEASSNQGNSRAAGNSQYATAEKSSQASSINQHPNISESQHKRSSYDPYRPRSFKGPPINPYFAGPTNIVIRRRESEQFPIPQSSRRYSRITASSSGIYPRSYTMSSAASVASSKGARRIVASRSRRNVQFSSYRNSVTRNSSGGTSACGTPQARAMGRVNYTSRTAVSGSQDDNFTILPTIKQRALKVCDEEEEIRKISSNLALTCDELFNIPEPKSPAQSLMIPLSESLPSSPPLPAQSLLSMNTPNLNDFSSMMHESVLPVAPLRLPQPQRVLPQARDLLVQTQRSLPPTPPLSGSMLSEVNRGKEKVDKVRASLSHQEAAREYLPRLPDTFSHDGVQPFPTGITGRNIEHTRATSYPLFSSPTKYHDNKAYDKTPCAPRRSSFNPRTLIENAIGSEIYNENSTPQQNVIKISDDTTPGTGHGRSRQPSIPLTLHLSGLPSSSSVNVNSEALQRDERGDLSYLARAENTIRIVGSRAVKQKITKIDPVSVAPKYYVKQSELTQTNNKENSSTGHCKTSEKISRQGDSANPTHRSVHTEIKNTSASGRCGRKATDNYQEGGENNEQHVSARFTINIQKKKARGGQQDVLVTSPVTEAGPHDWDTYSNISNVPTALRGAPPLVNKRKSSLFPFWRREKGVAAAKAAKITVDCSLSESSAPNLPHLSNPRHSVAWAGLGENDRSSSIEHGARVTGREIEVHQGWLRRLLQMKPARQHLCFNCPRREARRQVSMLLRDWRRFGVRDIEVDRARAIVWARVDKKNFLDLKPLALAIEFSMVTEETCGTIRRLSIARITLERGPTASFNQACSTLAAIMDGRGLLIKQATTCRRMIKTLQSAPPRPAAAEVAAASQHPDYKGKRPIRYSNTFAKGFGFPLN